MDYQSEKKREHNKKHYEKNTPYPVRLGALKDVIMRDAFDTDKSGHYVIIAILRKHYEGKLEIGS